MEGINVYYSVRRAAMYGEIGCVEHEKLWETDASRVSSF